MKQTISYSFIGGCILVFALIIAYGDFGWRDAFGSVSVTDEYQATSTAANAVYGANAVAQKVLKTASATLGSVVITGANTGTLNFYDATTTSVLLRATGKATSTILIASLPANAAAGTYTFDAQTRDGLLWSLVEGTMPTSTITYR